MTSIIHSEAKVRHQYKDWGVFATVNAAKDTIKKAKVERVLLQERELRELDGVPSRFGVAELWRR